MLQSVALEMKHGSQSFTLFYKVSVKKVSLTLSVCEIPKFGSSVTDCFFFFSEQCCRCLRLLFSLNPKPLTTINHAWAGSGRIRYASL